MSGRRVIAVPVGEDPAGFQVVERDRLFFSSTVDGRDLATGRLSADPAAQVEATLHNLETLLERAGASPANLGLVTICIAQPEHERLLDGAWQRLVPDEGRRPACKVNCYQLPTGVHAQVYVVGMVGEEAAPLAIPGTGASDVPAGAGLGPLVFSSAVAGRDPLSGVEPADPEAQIRQAFRNLAAILKAADATWDDVIHVYAFLQDRPRRQPILDKVWPEIFPDWGQCPARKAVQYDALNGGSQVVQLQAVAVRGQGPRRDFTLPNVPVHDTGTMGAALGRYLWSSGLAGNPAGRLGTLEEQAEWAFRHMGVLVEQAGGGLDGVGQVTILVRDYVDEPTILEHWRATFPDAADEPAHHVAAFGLNPLNAERVQLHVAAAF